MIAAEPRELTFHARFEFPLEHVGEVGSKCLIRRAEEAGPRAVPDERSALHHVDESRSDVFGGALESGHDRAHCRATAHRLQVFRVESALTLKRVVPAGRPGQGSNESKSVGRCGDSRHQLAHLKAGQGGLDRKELAADLGRGRHFHIDHVHVWRSTIEMNEDHRLL